MLFLNIASLRAFDTISVLYLNKQRTHRLMNSYCSDWTEIEAIDLVEMT